MATNVWQNILICSSPSSGGDHHVVRFFLLYSGLQVYAFVKVEAALGLAPVGCLNGADDMAVC